MPRSPRSIRAMPDSPRVIIQVPRGSAVEQALRSSELPGDVVTIAGPADAEANLEPPAAGEVVMSVASPEALAREPDEVRRVIAGAGRGAEPLVVVVEAAEEIRSDELAAVLAAAGHTSRGVILRVLRNV
jgi:hypothetical protein